jgi:hypothetical protein
MKLYRLLFLLVTCAGWLPVAAQGTIAAASAAPAPITPGQRQAAASLLNAIYSEGSFDQLIEQVLVSQLKEHPEAKPYENEMRAFFKKYMSWSSLKGEMAEVYAREYTEAELLDIKRFYESPTGRKAAAKMPMLMQKGMELGQRRVQEHLPELQKAIADKMGQ